MAAWSNNKATAIPQKRVNAGNLSKPVKPTDIEKNPVAKAVEGKHQTAACKAAEILAEALVGRSDASKGHVTITMSGTSSNPPAISDVISVAVTLANPPGADKESDVEPRL
jgi:hypothetical protein